MSYLLAGGAGGARETSAKQVVGVAIRAGKIYGGANIRAFRNAPYTKDYRVRGPVDGLSDISFEGDRLFHLSAATGEEIGNERRNSKKRMGLVDGNRREDMKGRIKTT